MERDSNIHHAFWERGWYRGHVEKGFREHRGLKVRMFIPIHAELHRKVQAPPKPPRELLLGATAFLDEIDPQTLYNVPETLRELSEWFSERELKVADRIGENLLKQIPFIERGMA